MYSWNCLRPCTAETVWGHVQRKPVWGQSWLKVVKQQKSQQAFIEESFSCTSWCIPSANSSLGCAWTTVPHHPAYREIPWTYSLGSLCLMVQSFDNRIPYQFVYDVLQRDEFYRNWSKVLKIVWQLVWAVCRMSEHLTLHGIQLVLNSANDTQMGNAARWCHPWTYHSICSCSESWFAASEAFDISSLHWQCHYMIWCAEAKVFQFPSCPVWMASLRGTPPSGCTVMAPILGTQPVNCTVLHNCLPLCLLSQICICAICATAVLSQMILKCICLM
jgi:hypothetical protein